MLRCYLAKMLNVILFTIAMVLVAFTTVVSRATVAVAQRTPKITSIAEARALPLGTIVTIEGSVTVPSGAFKSSFDDEGFVIQDMSSGIYVSAHTNLNLAVRQRVRVTGKLAETNAQFRIVEAEASSIEVRGRGKEVKPKAVSTGKVNEQTLGQLLKVTGTISNPIVSIAPFGFRLPVNDGTGETVVYVSTSTRITQENLQQGQRISVMGIGGQFKGQYQIFPRFPADIKLLPKTKTARGRE
ncbi:MAG TPA: hypothetical protein VM095_21365 [Pyrinomonadaceae bacterium]|nr:hypothetical protein [Pyrinomonadaceae bacterium]